MSYQNPQRSFQTGDKQDPTNYFQPALPCSGGYYPTYGMPNLWSYPPCLQDLQSYTNIYDGSQELFNLPPENWEMPAQPNTTNCEAIDLNATFSATAPATEAPEDFEKLSSDVKRFMKIVSEVQAKTDIQEQRCQELQHE